MINSDKEKRMAKGRAREEARFTAVPSKAELPGDYAATLHELKQRITGERLRVVMAANAGMVFLYWDIGQTILQRQATEGWGAKVIDRLSADLRQAFPDMKGLSPRNLKYMRAFAEAWPDKAIVQRVIAQLPWRQNIALMERLDDPNVRLWYARKTVEQGWSQPILCLQIEGQAHERQGKALTNFPATLPPADSDMAAQVFKRLTRVLGHRGQFRNGAK